MLDIKLIREQPVQVKEGIRKKGEDDTKVDDALDADEQRRDLLQKSEALKSRKNTVSAEVARRKAKSEDASALIAEMKQVAETIKSLDDALNVVEEKLRSILLQIPNIPHSSVPIGATPGENRTVATWGNPPVIDFAPKPTGS
jgi:seryl-tRNA synthetase